jgi:putative ABC transport system permease protein
MADFVNLSPAPYVSTRMTWLWHDVRFGLRSFLKDRSFFGTAILALGLGIGSTTAIYSVIDNVLLEPFPYTDGQRLMAIQLRDIASNDQFGREFFSVPEFLDYQEQNRVFDRSIGVRRDAVLMTGQGAPESFDGATVTGNTFDFLGVAPLLGRAITPEDARPGAPPVFVLSYKLWKRRFGSDASILGKTFTMNDRPTTLVGIMPQRFAWWGAELWIPTALTRSEPGAETRFFFLLGHLKPGLTAKSAAPDIAIIAKRLAKLYPKDYPKQFTASLESLVDNVVGKFRITLYTLLAAVGLLLLIACGNVANLLLARSTAREKEMAIRATLGASRWKLVRQLMVEGLMLALIGAAAGCLFAWAGLKGLVSLIPQFTFPDEAVIHLNRPVLLTTVATAVLTALIFGLFPALGASRRDLNEPLKSSGRGNSGFRRGRWRNVLVVSEVALSLVLLTGAGLLMRSFFLQRAVDLGISSENVLTMGLNLPPQQYKTAEQQSRFLRNLLPRIEALRGVVAVSGALAFPPFGGIDTGFDVHGKTESQKWKGQMVLCSPRFFDTLHARVLRGRPLTEQDMAGVRRVAIVNQTLASKFFPREDPIGRSIKLARLETAPVPVADPWFEIIGISSDMKNHGVRDAVLPEVYVPYSHSSFGGYQLFVRTVGSPAQLARVVEGKVLGLDRNVVPQRTRAMAEEIDLFEFAKPRFGMILFAVFAGIGLILVSVGVYSVISYTVSQQSHEIGIRMALGASVGNVRTLVILAGLRFIFIGVATGLVLSFVLTRALASEFFGVSPYDPVTLSTVIAVLTLVGLAACYVPSSRATRVDPAISLRYD